MNVCPAMVRVPAREEALVLDDTRKPTEPLPLPVAPLVTEMNAALLTADHGHSAPALTATIPEPPEESNDCDPGEIEYVHKPPFWLITRV